MVELKLKVLMKIEHVSSSTSKELKRFLQYLIFQNDDEEDDDPGE